MAESICGTSTCKF